MHEQVLVIAIDSTKSLGEIHAEVVIVNLRKVMSAIITHRAASISASWLIYIFLPDCLYLSRPLSSTAVSASSLKGEDQYLPRLHLA